MFLLSFVSYLLALSQSRLYFFVVSTLTLLLCFFQRMMATEAKLFNTEKELEKMREVASQNTKLKEQVHKQLACFENKVKLLSSLDSCCHHAKTLHVAHYSKSIKDINTTHFKYLFIMSRCNCITRSIILKAIVLELCP